MTNQIGQSRGRFDIHDSKTAISERAYPEHLGLSSIRLTHPSL